MMRFMSVRASFLTEVCSLLFNVASKYFLFLVKDHFTLQKYTQLVNESHQTRYLF